MACVFYGEFWPKDWKRSWNQSWNHHEIYPQGFIWKAFERFFCFWDICHTLVRHPIWLTRCYKNSSWVGIEFQDNTRGDVSGNGQSWALKICRIKQVLETSYEHQQFTSLQFTCSLHNIHTCFERCFFFDSLMLLVLFSNNSQCTAAPRHDRTAFVCLRRMALADVAPVFF